MAKGVLTYSLGEKNFPQRGDREKSLGAFFSARGVITPIEWGLGKIHIGVR